MFSSRVYEVLTDAGFRNRTIEIQKCSYSSGLSVNMSRLGQQAGVLGAFPPMKRLVDCLRLFNPANPFGGEPLSIDTREQDLLNTGIGVEWLSSFSLNYRNNSIDIQIPLLGGTPSNNHDRNNPCRHR